MSCTPSVSMKASIARSTSPSSSDSTYTSWMPFSKCSPGLRKKERSPCETRRERKERNFESRHYRNCPVLQAKEWFVHLHHSLLSKLRFSIDPHGVQNHTVLPAVQSRHINHPDNLLCNRGYVSFSVCHSHQPLLSSAAISAPGVTERPESSHMQRFLMKKWQAGVDNYVCGKSVLWSCAFISEVLSSLITMCFTLTLLLDWLTPQSLITCRLKCEWRNKSGKTCGDNIERDRRVYLVREDESIDNIHNLFVSSRQVSSHLTDLPFLTWDTPHSQKHTAICFQICMQNMKCQLYLH